MRLQLTLGLLLAGLAGGSAAAPPLDLKLRLRPGAS